MRRAAKAGSSGTTISASVCGLVSETEPLAGLLLIAAQRGLVHSAQAYLLGIGAPASPQDGRTRPAAQRFRARAPIPRRMDGLRLEGSGGAPARDRAA